MSFDWLKAVFLLLCGKHGKIHSIIRHRIRHREQYGGFTL